MNFHSLAGAWIAFAAIAIGAEHSNSITINMPLPIPHVNERTRERKNRYVTVNAICSHFLNAEHGGEAAKKKM